MGGLLEEGGEVEGLVDDLFDAGMFEFGELGGEGELFEGEVGGEGDDGLVELLFHGVDELGEIGGLEGLVWVRE